MSLRDVPQTRLRIQPPIDRGGSAREDAKRISRDCSVAFITGALGREKLNEENETWLGPRVLAEGTKLAGALTVAVVSYPFLSEGAMRRRWADQDLWELRQECDAVAVLYCDRLLEDEEIRNLTLDDAFDLVAKMLSLSIHRGAKEILTNIAGRKKLDFSNLPSAVTEAAWSGSIEDGNLEYAVMNWYWGDSVDLRLRGSQLAESENPKIALLEWGRYGALIHDYVDAESKSQYPEHTFIGESFGDDELTISSILAEVNIEDYPGVARLAKSIDTGDRSSEEQLREEIRELLLAGAGGHPKYAYSNELLDEIVRIKPRSKSELRKIKGMGIRRMESSEDILEIVENWLMQRCMDSIQTNYQRIVFSSENQNLRLTPEELDEMSKPFVEWVKGRENSVKRISTVETKEEILELMADPLICNSNFQIQVSKLKDELRGRGLNIQPSRLSQIITSLVNDGLITREKPVPYKKGVVLLQLTEKGRKKMFDTKEPNQDSDIRHLYNE